MTAEEKKEKQKKETWINNVIKVYNFPREKVEKMYNKIYKL